VGWSYQEREQAKEQIANMLGEYNLLEQFFWENLGLVINKKSY